MTTYKISRLVSYLCIICALATMSHSSWGTAIQPNLVTTTPGQEINQSQSTKKKYKTFYGEETLRSKKSKKQADSDTEDENTSHKHEVIEAIIRGLIKGMAEGGGEVLGRYIVACCNSTCMRTHGWWMIKNIGISTLAGAYQIYGSKLSLWKVTTGTYAPYHLGGEIVLRLAGLHAARSGFSLVGMSAVSFPAMHMLVAMAQKSIIQDAHMVPITKNLVLARALVEGTEWIGKKLYTMMHNETKEAKQQTGSMASTAA